MSRCGGCRVPPRLLENENVYALYESRIIFIAGVDSNVGQRRSRRLWRRVVEYTLPRLQWNNMKNMIIDLLNNPPTKKKKERKTFHRIPFPSFSSREPHLSESIETGAG